MRGAIGRHLVLTGAIVIGLAVGLSAQPRPRRIQPMRPPPPEGRQIETADGDTVVVTGDDRVSVIRRRTAEVRVAFDQERRTVLVIADWGTPTDVKPDGGVNRTWLFSDIDGAWPLDHRWQGAATIIEPESLRGETVRAAATLTIEMPAGPVVFISGRPDNRAPLPDGTVIWHRKMSGGGPDGVSFDEAERYAQSGNAQWSFSSASGLASAFPSTVVRPGGGASATLGPAASGAATGFAMAPSGPQLIRRVEPAWPDRAAHPGLRGVILVELAVALDGTVRGARAVRSLPPLDALVLAAASQWRYAPAGPEGRPDPLLVTAAFPYPPLPRPR